MSDTSFSSIAISLNAYRKYINRCIIQHKRALEVASAIYGALDGLNISYSTTKCFFDVCYADIPTVAPDAMHTWMLTPAGIIIAVSGSLLTMLLACFANYFKKNDPNLFARYCVAIWPYVRDLLKASKNTYRTVRNLFTIMNFLDSGDGNITLWFIPAVIVGILSIANRMLYRNLTEQRNNLLSENQKLLSTICKFEKISLETHAAWMRQIQAQATLTLINRTLGFSSMLYSGFVDGLYYYLGVLVIAPLALPVFVAISILSVIYLITAITLKVYTEDAEQKKFRIMKIKLELALMCRTELLDAGMVNKNTQLIQCKLAELRSLETTSRSAVVMSGLKDGLMAYGLIMSIFYGAAAILSLAAISMPQLVIILVAALGLACLIGNVIYSLMAHCKSDATTTFQLYDFFDAIRTFFSGLAKGLRTSSYTLNPLLEQGNDGHYHDTLLTLIVGGFSAFIYAIIFF